MMNDLLKIKNEMGLPKGQSSPLRADHEQNDDKDADDQNEPLGVSMIYSPYHPGYTTKHWLMVFRSVEATF